MQSSGARPALTAALLALVIAAPAVAAQERVIVALGDSLTAGLGLLPDEALSLIHI